MGEKDRREIFKPRCIFLNKRLDEVEERERETLNESLNKVFLMN